MKKTGIFIFSLLWLSGTGFAQQNRNEGDTLNLEKVVDEVISTHPSVKAAAQAVEEAEGRIGLARSAYLPTVSAGASYTRIDPVISFDFPGYGNIQLYPEDNYSADVSVRQLIYDFGRTSKSIKLAEASKELSSESLNLVRQNMAMLVISTYYNLLMVQESVRISNDELKNLNNHLDFIMKKKATGSATDYEILSTKVKISAIENRKVDLLAGQQTLSAVMNALLGQPVDKLVYVSNELNDSSDSISADSMLNLAMKNREELKLSEQKEKLAQLRYELTKASNYPTLGAFATGGGKNGYIPNLNSFKANFSAGVSLNIPIFDGYREKNNLKIAKAEIESSQYQSETAQRQVSVEVMKARAQVKSSSEKIDQNRLQVTQAQQAYDLAQTNYQAGAITNLDLLDAEISLATSRLMLTRARIDYVLNLSQLKMAMGEDLYHVN